MSQLEEPTVLDATVLSNFAYLDEVQRLKTLPRLATVPAVHEELITGSRQHDFLQNALDHVSESGEEGQIPVLELEDDEYPDPVARLPFDDGEQQAIAVAAVREGTIVTDDRQARRWARREHIGLTGTIGVLVRLVGEDEIQPTTADDWLSTLVNEAGYHAPSDSIEDFL